MPQIECPQCHAVYELDTVRRTADDFCPTPTCDYPLFWAPFELIGDGENR